MRWLIEQDGKRSKKAFWFSLQAGTSLFIMAWASISHLAFGKTVDFSGLGVLLGAVNGVFSVAYVGGIFADKNGDKHE